MAKVTLAFIDALLEECHTTPISDEPPQHISASDVILHDEVSDNLKRIFTAIMNRAKQIETMRETGLRLLHDFDSKYPEVDNPHAHLSEEIVKAEDALASTLEKLKAEIDMKTGDLDLISDLFWRQVRHEYPELRHKRNIGIFHGWRLGWNKNLESEFSGRGVITISTLGELDALFGIRHDKPKRKKL